MSTEVTGTNIENLLREIDDQLENLCGITTVLGVDHITEAITAQREALNELLPLLLAAPHRVQGDRLAATSIHAHDASTDCAPTARHSLAAPGEQRRLPASARAPGSPAPAAEAASRNPGAGQHHPQWLPETGSGDHPDNRLAVVLRLAGQLVPHGVEFGPQPAQRLREQVVAQF
jgi:hypothetical protein